jgi:hypothetical protein
MNSRRERLLMKAGTAAAAILAAGLGLWVATSETISPGKPEQETAVQENAGRQSGTHLPSEQAPPARPYADEVPTTAQNTEQSGPEMLDQWLSSSTNPDEVGLAVMLGFSKLPAETHAAAARQMVNLVPDGAFDGMLRILLNPKTSTEAKGIIFQDVMIRPDALRLPALLEVMEQTEHPHAKDARYTLGTILGGDWGTDYKQWRARVDTELRRQKAAGG